MKFNIRNNVRTTLAQSLIENSSALALFQPQAPFNPIPNLDPDSELYLTIMDDINEPTKIEIVKLISSSPSTSNILTYGVERGKFGTIAQSFPRGSDVFLAVTAELINYLQDSVIEELNDVDDVNIVNPVVNQNLTWDGNNWVNEDPTPPYQLSDPIVANRLCIGSGHDAALGVCSSIAGGINHTLEAGYSTIGGGWSNTIQGNSDYSGIFSGESNVIESNVVNDIPAGYSFIGGGRCNRIKTQYDPQYSVADVRFSVIAGGALNVNESFGTVISGGRANHICTGSYLSVISGGQTNRLDAFQSVIAGGSFNCIFTNNRNPDGITPIEPIGIGAGQNSVISGGGFNRVCGVSSFSTISGGYQNQIISSCYSTIGGGKQNCIIDSVQSSISGGQNNCIESPSRYSHIGGGRNNLVCSGTDYGTISGGYNNIASGWYSTVGGGCNNFAEDASTVGGGRDSCALCYTATVAGGYGNMAFSYMSTVGGGKCNSACGDATTIAGGSFNVSHGEFSVIGGGTFNQGCSSGTLIAGGCSNYANGRYSIISGGCKNNIKMCDPNSASSPWAFNTISGGTRNNITVNDVNLEVVYGATIGGGVGHNTCGGTLTQGCLSTVGGCAYTIFKSGNFSTIAGGLQNRAQSDFSTVSGGKNNIVDGLHSFIGGGYKNHVCCANSSIIGGTCNKIENNFSNILGGNNNVTYSPYNSILNGVNNATYADCSTVINGNYNRVYSFFNTILNGHNNGNFSDFNTVANGCKNCTFSDYNTILNGCNNYTGSDHATVISGISNAVRNDHSIIASGAQNEVMGAYSSIIGGRNNVIQNSVNNTPLIFSTILGGQNNNTCQFENVFILGSNINANASNTTFVNNLYDFGAGTSDERLKENLHSLAYGLDQLNKLEPVEFNFCSDEEKRKRFGFIAQCVQEIMPSAVLQHKIDSIDGDPVLKIDYDAIWTSMVNAIKTLDERLKKLENDKKII